MFQRILVVGERIPVWPYDADAEGALGFDLILPSRTLYLQDNTPNLFTQAQIQTLARQIDETNVLYQAFVFLEDNLQSVFGTNDKQVLYHVWKFILVDVLRCSRQMQHILWYEALNQLQFQGVEVGDDISRVIDAVSFRYRDSASLWFHDLHRGMGRAMARRNHYNYIVAISHGLPLVHAQHRLQYYNEGMEAKGKSEKAVHDDNPWNVPEDTTQLADFLVASQMQRWPADGQYRAAIKNLFGWCGTIIHNLGFPVNNNLQAHLQASIAQCVHFHGNRFHGISGTNLRNIARSSRCLAHPNGRRGSCEQRCGFFRAQQKTRIVNYSCPQSYKRY